MKRGIMDQHAPHKKAAALRYDPEMTAPIITAAGEGYVAQKILQKAKEHDIPVIEDASAADVLSRFSVGDAIPPRLYEAVAQILIFVSQIDEHASNKK